MNLCPPCRQVSGVRRPDGLASARSGSTDRVVSALQTHPAMPRFLWVVSLACVTLSALPFPAGAGSREADLQRLAGEILEVERLLAHQLDATARASAERHRDRLEEAARGLARGELERDTDDRAGQDEERSEKRDVRVFDGRNVAPVRDRERAGHGADAGDLGDGRRRGRGEDEERPGRDAGARRGGDRDERDDGRDRMDEEEDIPDQEDEGDEREEEEEENKEEERERENDSRSPRP